MEKRLQRPLGKSQLHFKCIKSKGQEICNTLILVTKVHMFLFVLTVSLNMTKSLFSIILKSMWKRATAPPGSVRALNPKVRKQATCFTRSLRCTVSVCPHCVLKHGRSLFSIILTSMWTKGYSTPWGRVRGILNALNPKVRKYATH